MKSILTTITLAASALLLHADTPKPDKDGWIVLFDGSDFSQWQSATGDTTKWALTDGAMTGQDGSGDIWSKERFGDFVLEVEFKTTGNSGVFFRTDNPKDNVQTGIEIQVENPGGPDKHSVGAIYDLVAPAKNAGKKDEWNKYVITCKGPDISVELNGEKVSAINLDEWPVAGKGPDGSDNKFKTALKDFKREGHIGFQDHGHKVWYRNVRLKPLKS